MSITINIYYTGKNGSARAFMEEMLSSGTVAAIRQEEGNIQYEYFTPVDDEETILLIDKWTDQKALDMHHEAPVMDKIVELRKKYNLTMKVERYLLSHDELSDNDKRYILR